jgi:hypothetical protein
LSALLDRWGRSSSSFAAYAKVYRLTASEQLKDATYLGPMPIGHLPDVEEWLHLWDRSPGGLHSVVLIDAVTKAHVSDAIVRTPLKPPAPPPPVPPVVTAEPPTTTAALVQLVETLKAEIAAMKTSPPAPAPPREAPPSLDPFALMDRIDQAVDRRVLKARPEDTLGGKSPLEIGQELGRAEARTTSIDNGWSVFKSFAPIAGDFVVGLLDKVEAVAKSQLDVKKQELELEKVKLGVRAMELGAEPKTDTDTKPAAPATDGGP